MYVCPQAGQKIAHDCGKEHLAGYGYSPAPITTVLWQYNNRPTTFTLVFDNFGMKYHKRKDALHLKNALKYLNTIITDWDGALYIDITLKWEFTKGTIQLSMPGYVKT